MKVVIYVVLTVVLLVSCKEKKSTHSNTESVDSSVVQVKGDTIDTVSKLSKAVDGLFDDFVYTFMRNKQFQRGRIKFPLTYVVDGVDQSISQTKWVFDPLYVNQDVYTLVFDNAHGIKAEKDTSLHHVVFEWVYLTKKRVKQYIFDKEDGRWLLTAIDVHDMNRNVNSDFYAFYDRFSTEKSFQNRHILNPFYFKTYDYENFRNIEGLLDVNQWPDFRPHLPSGVITNINYGQSYDNSNRRVLMICSQSGGMGCSLTFVRKRNIWYLERLEN